MTKQEHETKKLKEREYYKNNKEKFLNKNRKRRKCKREWFRKRREGLSCKCGESRWYVLDFHHKSGENKRFGLATGTNLGYSEKLLEEEISKCEVLCANCHRELHYLESLKEELDNINEN